MKKIGIFLIINLFAVSNINSQEINDSILNSKFKMSSSLDSAKAKYDVFVEQTKNRYREFRLKCNQEYAEFMRKAWKEYGAEPPLEKPKMNKLKVVPKIDPSKKITTNSIAVNTVLTPEKRVEQPQPICEIPEEMPFVSNEIPTFHTEIDFKATEIKSIDNLVNQDGKKLNFSIKKSYQWLEFDYYGTHCKVRLSKHCLFNLKDCEPNTIADAWLKLSESKYSNAIRDCLSIRRIGKLCDWGYLLLLKALSDELCGKDTNESAMLTAYLYCQSGYKMRLGTSDNKLYMMFGTKDRLYNKSSAYIIDGVYYYMIREADVKYMSFCDVKFPNEEELSLLVWDSPNLELIDSEKRLIQSRLYPELKAETKVNKNLVDFYNDYPESESNNNFMTRWAMYANTELSQTAKELLYPNIKKEIEGKSQFEAVSKILNFVQTGFVYKLDDEVWGRDRIFFADESLYYPYCDCEDRSILFSRIVRDLVGLQVVLVYYPGHLYTAVHFDDPIPGDYIQLDGKNFTVCDPTFIYGAPVGMTAQGMNNSGATVVLLE